MNTPPPLSPELEAFLAPYRPVLPLPPAVHARAMARASAAMERSSPLAGGVAIKRRQPWVFVAAIGTLIVVSAAAYAAHARIRWVLADGLTAGRGTGGP